MKEDLREPEQGKKPENTKNYELGKLLLLLGATIGLVIVALLVL